MILKVLDVGVLPGLGLLPSGRLGAGAVPLAGAGAVTPGLARAGDFVAALCVIAVLALGCLLVAWPVALWFLVLVAWGAWSLVVVPLILTWLLTWLLILTGF